MRLRDLVRAAENKYNRLLTILTLIYISSPFLLDWSVGNFIVVFIFLGAMIVVVYQIQHSKKALRVHLSLVILALLLQWLNYLPSASTGFSRFSDYSNTIILLIFLALSIYVILKELIGVEQVTSDIVKGGICIYFLFGFFWTALYDIVYSLDANAFHAATITISRSDLNHFSFTTLTTVGYGDISPVSELARVLANLEAIVGVLYPSVFIARLVALHNNH